MVPRCRRSCAKQAHCDRSEDHRVVADFDESSRPGGDKLPETSLGSGSLPSGSKRDGGRALTNIQPADSPRPPAPRLRCLRVNPIRDTFGVQIGGSRSLSGCWILPNPGCFRYAHQREPQPSGCWIQGKTFQAALAAGRLKSIGRSSHAHTSAAELLPNFKLSPFPLTAWAAELAAGFGDAAEAGIVAQEQLAGVEGFFFKVGTVAGDEQPVADFAL